MAQVIWKVCHVRCPLPQTWRLLRQLGWTHQRPARRARERDEAAIARWVRTSCPLIRKSPAAERGPGLSRRERLCPGPPNPRDLGSQRPHTPGSGTVQLAASVGHWRCPDISHRPACPVVPQFAPRRHPQRACRAPSRPVAASRPTVLISAKSLSTVPLATPVMRRVALMEFPSTRALTTWVRCLRSGLFMALVYLSVHALSLYDIRHFVL
ncbi:MAG: winged helix-turn-helix domain-containing protein [Armatimonadetes bacterium]|nr:winged helix-turn-helix domain-containing protein [Armatimonadota bacterium]